MTTDFDFAAQLRSALQRVAEREEQDDDTPVSLEALPALDDFSPFGSPLSSVTTSCCTSRSTSPELELGPNSDLDGDTDLDPIPMFKRSAHSPPRKVLRTSQNSVNDHVHNSGAQSPPSQPQPPATGRQRKKERAREKKKERVAAKKEKARIEGTQFQDAFTYKVRCRFSGKYQDVLVISCDIDASYLPHASSSYVGARQTAGNVHITLQTLLGEGFRLIEWDGRCVFFSRYPNPYSWQNQHTCSNY